MLTEDLTLSVQLSRTLWFNTFRGKVTDSAGNYIASVRIIPTVPLDREEIPENAPEAIPLLIVMVDDGVVTTEDLVSFEAKLAPVLLEKFKRDDFKPEFCQYFYPSPMSMLESATCPQ